MIVGVQLALRNVREITFIPFNNMRISLGEMRFSNFMTIQFSTGKFSCVVSVIFMPCRNYLVWSSTGT